jgi:hypothetical protein
MKTTSMLCGFLGLVTLAMGGNSRHGGFDRNEPRVILYEDANFKGGSLVLYAGDRIPDLNRARFSNGKRINDQISSVRVEGGATVMLFDHYDFNGQVMRADADIRNLARRDMPDMDIAWNDRISSLVVKGERQRIPQPRPSVDPMIQSAYRDVLGRGADRDGLAYYRGLVIEQGWTDRMVREHMRDSREYRHEVVERMIARAYQDILGRAPDAMGLANYRRLLIDQNWTEKRLRDALRKSPEFRQNRMASAR